MLFAPIGRGDSKSVAEHIGWKATLMQTIGVSSLAVISSCMYHRKWLESCSDETCMIVAHHINIDADSFIFKKGEFQGLTCFQIAHHPLMSGLQNCNQACKRAIEAEAGEIQRKGSLV